jgi:hypothetical protein
MLWTSGTMVPANFGTFSSAPISKAKWTTLSKVVKRRLQLVTIQMMNGKIRAAGGRIWPVACRKRRSGRVISQNPTNAMVRVEVNRQSGRYPSFWAVLKAVGTFPDGNRGTYIWLLFLFQACTKSFCFSVLAEQGFLKLNFNVNEQIDD